MITRKITTWPGSNTAKKSSPFYEMENLSLELIFQILLDLPHSDIESYCLTSWTAREICRSEYFWQQKAKDLPLPLSGISGESLMRQYILLKTLLDLPPSESIQICIANGYTKLIKYFLQQEYDKTKMFPLQQIQAGLFEAVRKNHLDSIIITRDYMFSQLPEYYLNDLNRLFNTIYLESIRLRRKEIQGLLGEFSKGDPISLLEAAFSTHQYDLSEEIMSELISSDPERATDILDDFMSDAVMDDDLDLVRYLVERYREFIDLDSHLRAARRREHYSIAGYLDQV